MAGSTRRRALTLMSDGEARVGDGVVDGVSICRSATRRRCKVRDVVGEMARAKCDRRNEGDK